MEPTIKCRHEFPNYTFLSRALVDSNSQLYHRTHARALMMSCKQKNRFLNVLWSCIICPIPKFRC